MLPIYLQYSEKIDSITMNTEYINPHHYHDHEDQNDTQPPVEINSYIWNVDLNECIETNTQVDPNGSNISTEEVVDSDVCCQQGTNSNPQDSELMLACQESPEDPSDESDPNEATETQDPEGTETQNPEETETQDPETSDPTTPDPVTTEEVSYNWAITDTEDS